MSLKILFVIFVCVNAVNVFALDPDARLGVVALIEKYKYPVEEVKITSDGYELTIHRIAHGLENAAEPNKPPVLIMHDILSSSVDFVNMGTRSLAFILADKGYDVWIANARGNTHSKKHTSLSTADKEFWDFSWDEIGDIDLPNIIDYITENTGFSQIYYIGHGQGTTVFYVMASLHPEYNEKVALMISLAPVAFNRHLTNPALRLVNSIISLKEIMDASTPSEFFGNNWIISEVLMEICDDSAMLVEICAGFLFLMYGFDSTQLDRAKVPVILYNAAAGASSKQFHHYAQLFYTDNFARFDHGTATNIIEYGQETPPNYDLSQVTAPVAIFYGTNDWLASVTDVQTLVNHLPNVVENYRVLFDDYNHMDFLFARDNEKLVYARMLELMSDHKIQ